MAVLSARVVCGDARGHSPGADADVPLLGALVPPACKAKGDVSLCLCARVVRIVLPAKEKSHCQLTDGTGRRSHSYEPGVRMCMHMCMYATHACICVCIWYT